MIQYYKRPRFPIGSIQFNNFRCANCEQYKRTSGGYKEHGLPDIIYTRSQLSLLINNIGEDIFYARATTYVRMYVCTFIHRLFLYTVKLICHLSTCNKEDSHEIRAKTVIKSLFILAIVCLNELKYNSVQRSAYSLHQNKLHCRLLKLHHFKISFPLCIKYQLVTHTHLFIYMVLEDKTTTKRPNHRNFIFISSNFICLRFLCNPLFLLRTRHAFFCIYIPENFIADLDSSQNVLQSQ